MKTEEMTLEEILAQESLWSEREPKWAVKIRNVLKYIMFAGWGIAIVIFLGNGDLVAFMSVVSIALVSTIVFLTLTLQLWIFRRKRNRILEELEAAKLRHLDKECENNGQAADNDVINQWSTIEKHRKIEKGKVYKRVTIVFAGFALIYLSAAVYTGKPDPWIGAIVFGTAAIGTHIYRMRLIRKTKKQ
jgi:Flp pilus assembly protein TadB